MQKLAPEVMAVKDDNFWTLFCETGEPLYWLLSRERPAQDKKPEPVTEKSKERAAHS